MKKKLAIAAILAVVAIQGYAALSTMTTSKAVVQHRLDRLQAAEAAAVK